MLAIEPSIIVAAVPGDDIVNGRAEDLIERRSAAAKPCELGNTLRDQRFVSPEIALGWIARDEVNRAKRVQIRIAGEIGIEVEQSIADDDAGAQPS